MLQSSPWLGWPRALQRLWLPARRTARKSQLRRNRGRGQHQGQRKACRRQIEIVFFGRAIIGLIPLPDHFECATASSPLSKHRSPGSDSIQTDLGSVSGCSPGASACGRCSAPRAWRGFRDLLATSGTRSACRSGTVQRGHVLGGHLSGTYISITKSFSGVDKGSFMYCSMNRSFPSSFFSSR